MIAGESAIRPGLKSPRLTDRFVTFSIWVALVALIIDFGISRDLLAANPSKALTVRIQSGKWNRLDTPIRLVVPADSLSAEARDAISSHPIALRMIPEAASAKPIIVQAERVGSGRLQDIELTWVVAGPMSAGGEFRFQLDPAPLPHEASSWRFQKVKQGEELRHDDRLVFRYNSVLASSSAYGPIQHRDAYLHPAYSPSGALITGDFSPFHPHHRGFFLAYAKAQVGDEPLDFWNIHTNKGKIRHTSIEETIVGRVTARISTRHLWEDKAGQSVLRERWDLEAIDVPGSSYWLFDLTSTQEAVGRPFEILPYRYGGMAYRGPEPFVKGKLDVLTAEGRHRVDGNLQPTRWVDLTGPIADGSTTYAGAMMADHPGNIHHPTVVRIHPITLPFFNFVPASQEKVTIDPKIPLVFRYRILIHDGHPDALLNERVWRDFAEPPKVIVTSD